MKDQLRYVNTFAACLRIHHTWKSG